MNPPVYGSFPPRGTVLLYSLGPDVISTGRYSVAKVCNSSSEPLVEFVEHFFIRGEIKQNQNHAARALERARAGAGPSRPSFTC